MAKTIRRAIAILLAATAIILLVLPAGGVEAAYTKGDYVIDGGTLVSYTGTENDITVPLGITEIGKDAFSGNNYLQTVYIPDEVTTIDYAAFENCKNLQKVVIGDGVKEIGSSAFSGCQSLTEINIPRYTETIGSGTFAACPNLSTIDVNPKNRYFICLDGVLYSKDGNKLYQYLAGRPYSTYDIPQPVKEIGEFGFYGANMLTNVSVASGVEEIPEYAFLNCTALTNVQLPGSVRAIRKGAFGGCPNLTSLNVPTSVGFIDDEAFVSLEGEKGNVVNETTGEVLSQSDSQPVGSSVQNNTGKESNTDNQQNTSETSGEIGTTTIVGGEAVFLINPKSMEVKGFDINAAQTEDSIADSGNSSSEGEDIRGYSGKEFDVVSGNFGHYGGNESNVTLPSGITKVGNRVFYKNQNIDTVELPDSVTEIGDFSFARSSLKSISIPDGTKEIGYAAFYNCAGLSDIYVPSSITDIGLAAFEGTAFLDNWRSIEDGNNYLVLGDGILVAYKGHGSEIKIPSGVKQIGPGVFEGNTRIKSVTLPDSLVKICEDSFNGCKSLKDIDFNNGLETIEDRAFKDTGLKLVTIPQTVKSIGLGAFDTTGTNGGLDIAIFRGSDLPDITYKPTATRLSATKLRSNAFEGTKYAFIPAGSSVNSGTVFDEYSMGFRGDVFSTAQIENNDKGKYLQLRKVLNEPDINGKVKINSSIIVGNDEYFLSGVSDTAFSAYENPSWCKNKLTDITLDGNKSDELNTLLGNVNFSASTGSNATSSDENSAIKVNVSDSSLASSHVEAVLPDSKEKFNLNISKDETLKPLFNEAFDNRFDTHDGINVDTYSIDMTDRLGNIPIKKMATSKLNITMPLPKQFYGDSASAEDINPDDNGTEPDNKNKNNNDSHETLEDSEEQNNMYENIRVATLDENGLLEEVSCSVNDTPDGTKTITFVASHLSPFAIYEMNSNLIKNIDGETLSPDELSEEKTTVKSEEFLSGSLTKQVIFGTLQKEVAPGIPARYFVAVILICLSGILLLYKGKRKTGRHVN